MNKKKIVLVNNLSNHTTCTVVKASV